MQQTYTVDGDHLNVVSTVWVFLYIYNHLIIFNHLLKPTTMLKEATVLFKGGIYKSQLNLIVILLVALLIGQFFVYGTSNKSQEPEPETQTYSNSTQMYDESDLEHAAGAYQLVLEDDFIVVKCGERVVGTLTYRTSLGRMMIRDNE